MRLLTRACSPCPLGRRGPVHRGKAIRTDVGLLPLVCMDADKVEDGSELTVNLPGGYVESGGKKYRIEPVPAFLQEIVDAGGLVEYAKDLAEVKTCTGSQS